ncbi:MAG TPA: YidB family protein [Bacteroidota bacterium]|nr:YidB family protein [Bacteroidota bacterium]
MGILDSITGAVTGGTNNSGIMDAIGGLLGDQASGGLSGLVENFTKGGLGDVVGSWVGTGENKPVSAGQIQSVLGNEHIQGIAAKLGLSTEDVSAGIASLLPQVIDKLTPDGKVPEQSAVQGGLGQIMNLFGGK